MINILKRRPFLITPWAIWIKPRLKLRYSFINHWVFEGLDEQGRARVLIVDEAYRYYWVRMTDKQYSFFVKRCPYM